MKTKGHGRVLFLTILFLAMYLLTACGKGGSAPDNTEVNTPPESTNNTEPIVQVVKAPTEPEKRYTYTEDISKDNCMFSDPQSKTVEAHYDTTETTKINISGDIKASAPGIELKIGSAIEKAYGSIIGEKTSEYLTWPAGTYYKYTVKHYEMWEKGAINVSMGTKKFPPIPYERLISYGLETERIPLDCPQPEADFSAGNQTTGQAPLSVQFIDKSKGYITDWLWNFGDGIGTSDKQNLVYTYNTPSYNYNTSGFCFEPNSYSVTLTVSNPQKSVSSQKENLITVLPKEYTIQIQPEPYALKDGEGSILHLPGCSQVCSIDLSGKTVRGPCMTSISSEQYDEIGYYFEGQEIGLQVNHQIRYCPGGNPPIQEGYWEFVQWSESFLNDNDIQISLSNGIYHNPKFEVKKSLYIRAHYQWIGPCNP